MKYQGIIFDLDGVLVYTDSYHFSAWKQIAQKLSIPFDTAFNNRLRGVGRMESLALILDSASCEKTQEEKKQLADEKNLMYHSLLKKLSQADLADDVVEVLTALKDAGIQLAVASSSRNAKTILERTGLMQYFDVITDGNDIKKAKPDPEVFLTAGSRLGLSPADCLVVEDAMQGVRGALDAHMDCAGIGDAVHHEQVTYRLTTLRDLLEIAIPKTE